LEKFADRGRSLARLNGLVIFVEGAVPGDRVRARIVKAKKSFADAQVLEILAPSDLRTAPRCFYFGTCGGCKWQHVEYTAQLEAKRQSVEDALVHHGGFREVRALQAIGSEKIYFYRNKMEFSFSAARWLTSEEIASGETYDTGFALGLHVPGNFEKVLDTKECHLQSELSVRMVNSFRDLAKSEGWMPYHIRKHEGFLRHLVIRTAAHTDEVMINLVTSSHEPERMEAVASIFQREFPQVTTFINTINSSLAQTAFGEEMHTVYGPGLIHDRIGPYTFEIAPNAFFQTNTRQAERLYEVTRTYAELKPDDLLYDLYCGAGTISIFVARDVKQVVGVELVEEAVVNARRNAEANGVTNCTFVSGDLMRLFTPEFVQQHGPPDVLIADPPRGGMHPKVVEQIARLRPERFIYVSCNPQTQARDLAMLKDLYTIEAVQPVDLFPHTYHIESVVKLRRNHER
jgi:23S rRNA (uracil1939-C5)-methyltransferase